MARLIDGEWALWVKYEYIKHCPKALDAFWVHFLSSVSGRLSMLTHWVRVTHICISKLDRPSLVQKMACLLFGAKPLREPMLVYCRLDPQEGNLCDIWIEIQFSSMESIWKCSLQNDGHLVSASVFEPTREDVMMWPVNQWHESEIGCWLNQGVKWMPEITSICLSVTVRVEKRQVAAEEMVGTDIYV